jgi:hypothetical protein
MFIARLRCRWVLKCAEIKERAHALRALIPLHDGEADGQSVPTKLHQSSHEKLDTIHNLLGGMNEEYLTLDHFAVT